MPANSFNSQPLVSFLIVAYDQENFIADSLRSALRQTYQPLEIIVTDDCSPDRTFDIVKHECDAYDGPHTVILNRNRQNLGISGNINKGLELCSGEFIVFHAGDDIARDNRVEKLTNRWLDKSDPVDLVVSHFAEIDESGQPTGYVKKSVAFTPEITKPVLQWTCGATGACAAYSRRIFDKYGPLDTNVISEDWVYSFRAWLESGIAVIEEPLLLHRTHGKCLSVSFGRDSIKRIPSRERRSKKRHQDALSRLAIAEEWMKAALISDRSGERALIKKLELLVKLRSLQAHAYTVSPPKALLYAATHLLRGGGVRETTSMVARNVLRIH